MERADFLRPKGNHKNLIAFQKAECIYDMTCYFVSHYLPAIGDRTVDQMKQAARSGKQNIAEGNEACTTSMESGIKLINVAKASLKELQEDSRIIYENTVCRCGDRLPSVTARQGSGAKQEIIRKNICVSVKTGMQRP